MKYLVVLSLVLLHNFTFSQSDESKDRYISFGIGSGYGWIQDRYDDGDFSYALGEYGFRPVLLNLRFNRKTNSGVLFAVNLQYALYTRTTGDVINGISMFFLTGGLQHYLESNSKFFITGNFGVSAIDESIGLVIGPGLGLDLTKRLSLELQSTYSRTFALEFTGYQLADLRLLLNYSF